MRLLAVVTFAIWDLGRTAYLRGNRSPIVDRVIFGGNIIETGTVSYRLPDQKPDAGRIRQPGRDGWADQVTMGQ